jgi:dihydroorotase
VIDALSKGSSGGGDPEAYADMRPPRSEVEAVRDATGLAETSGHATVNVCHISTAGALQIVDAHRRKGMRIHCEAALHHLYFDRRAMSSNPLLKTNPPLRGEDDRVALVRALREGKVDSLVTDHAPHTREEKVSEGAAGVPGLDDFGHVVAWLVLKAEVDPITIARIGSSNPARIYGLGDRGEIAEGKVADLTILDTSTPEVVKAERLMSKCGWSPYEGIEFPGGTKWTISGGRVILDSYEMAC